MDDGRERRGAPAPSRIRGPGRRGSIELPGSARFVPESMERSDNSSWTTVSSLLAAVAALITAVGGFIAIVASNNGPRDASSGSPTPSAPSGEASPGTSALSPTTTTPATCEEMFRITGPRDSQKISNRAGVFVEGTACDDEQVWLFDYDPAEGYFYKLNEEPLVISARRWGYRDRPIGDASDPRGTPYTIVAISASGACSAALRDFPPESKSLPTECPDHETAGTSGVRTVRVVKDRP